ncbi:MAG: hypothetical protein NTY09_15240 [bacterium]|nr:hypothetical protein [bacterium]
MQNRIIYFSTVTKLACILVILAMGIVLHAQQSTSRGGERGTRPEWDGVWSTDYGEMELGQHGNNVVGRYGAENGRLWGTVSGNTLDFEWEVQPDGGTFDNGTGEFTLGYGGANFTGSYVYSIDTYTENTWNGTRARDRIIEGTLSDVEYCVWHGSWRTDNGAIMFAQDIKSRDVTGEIILNGNHTAFTGTASGWNLDISFENADGISGLGSLTMSPDLGAFSGELIPVSTSTGEAANIVGSFIGTNLRSQFAGTWRMTWGDTEILQDDITGIVSGTVRDAEIGDQTGECSIEGIVVGDLCHLNWTLTSAENEISGQADLSKPSEDSINGTWQYTGSSEPGGKLNGKRE